MKNTENLVAYLCWQTLQVMHEDELFNTAELQLRAVSDKELIGMVLQLGANRVNQSPIKALMKFH